MCADDGRHWPRTCPWATNDHRNREANYCEVGAYGIGRDDDQDDEECPEDGANNHRGEECPEARPEDGAYVDACDQTHGGVPAWHEEVALLH